MVQFDENDLFYNDYVNTLGNLPDYIAIEDLNVLDIRQLYHVIYFCDAYLKRYRIDKDVENFQKVEKILRQFYYTDKLYKKDLIKLTEASFIIEPSMNIF